jgi:hypothetical protein
LDGEVKIPTPEPKPALDSSTKLLYALLAGFLVQCAAVGYVAWDVYQGREPGPEPKPVVKLIVPTLDDSRAETNGKRNDAVKPAMVEIVKAGNGSHVLTFQPDGADKVVWNVVVSGGVNPLPPGPEPGPKPPIPPEPSPDPPPIPSDGFRVLVVYENDPSDPASTLTKEQRGAMSSQAVRSYLDSKCAKGKDGKTPEWRMWDQHVELTNETDIWKDAMKLPRNVLPWIVISDGKGGYSGPLPANEAELLTLLKKYGGA